jgi:hypothetical protein
MNSCNIGRKGHGHGYWVDEMGKNPIVIWEKKMTYKNEYLTFGDHVAAL